MQDETTKAKRYFLEVLIIVENNWTEKLFQQLHTAVNYLDNLPVWVRERAMQSINDNTGLPKTWLQRALTQARCAIRCCFWFDFGCYDNI